jgi:predicted RNase H-like HicB family nuclease
MRTVRQTLQATIYSDSGGYVAECPDLRAVTQGDTLDETIENLREVIALALEDEDLPARGLVPNPTILVTVELEQLRRAG